MLVLTMLACSTHVHVKASHPAAEVGIMRQSYRPNEDNLNAQIKGTGEAEGTVAYSVFDKFWAYAKTPGREPTIAKIPQEVAPLPLVACIVFFLVPVGCFFVSRPTAQVFMLNVDDANVARERPRPEPTEVAAPAPAAAAVSSDVALRLKQLEAMRDQGVITEAEYQKKREEILDEL